MDVSENQTRADLTSTLEKVSAELEALERASLFLQQTVADLIETAAFEPKHYFTSLQDLDRMSQQINDVKKIVTHLKDQTPEGIQIDLETALSQLSLRTVAERFRDNAVANDEHEADAASGELSLF